MRCQTGIRYRLSEEMEDIKLSKSKASKMNGYFAAVSRQRNDVYKTQRGKKRRKG